MVESCKERLREVLEERNYNLGYFEKFFWEMTDRPKTPQGILKVHRTRFRALPDIEEHVFHYILTRSVDLGIPLTAGEIRIARHILRAVVMGWSYRDLAEKTGLAISTVRVYVSRLRRIIPIPYVFDWGIHKEKSEKVVEWAREMVRKMR